MPVAWWWAADAVAVLHAVWILAVLLGPLGVRRRPVWRAVHLVLLWVTAGLWRFYCPLTVFENVLRSRYDPVASYGGGFLEHYLKPLVDLTRYGTPLAAGVLVWTVLWTVVYGRWWVKERKRAEGKEG